MFRLIWKAVFVILLQLQVHVSSWSLIERRWLVSTCRSQLRLAHANRASQYSEFAYSCSTLTNKRLTFHQGCDTYLATSRVYPVRHAGLCLRLCIRVWWEQSYMYPNHVKSTITINNTSWKHILLIRQTL